MILKELSEAVGISGKEDAVRKVIVQAIDGHAGDIRIDALGSVTAVKKAKKRNALRVMLAAHMDEIGFMATGVDSNGLIRFVNVGGIDDRILPGLRVRVGDDLIPGVIIWTPIHKNQDQNVTKLSSLRIDIGANNKDSANGKVKAGDRIAFDSQYMEIGKETLRGKAFDDRAGCSLLVDVLQGGPYPVDVLAAFTVQEEIGLRGAKVAAQTLRPDVAFVLEGTTAHDVPNPTAEPDEEEEVNPACRMGGGPALTVMDRSVITDPRLLNFLRRTAEANDIPYQLKTQLGGGTDAGAIHLTQSGVPSAVISLPCRYIHSPAAYLNRDDYAHTLNLLQTVLNTITRAVLRR
jgi:tetrahedral aminopeptidase